LGRPWLATADAFIGCRSWDMTISHEGYIKKITFYLPKKASIYLEISPWLGNEDNDDEFFQPLLTIDQAMTFKEET
jgi:hypothetical protein